MYCLHLLILSHTDSCSLSFSASIAQTLVWNTLQIYIVLNIILFIIIISIFFNRIIIYPSPFSINNFWSFLLQLKSCPSFDVESLKLTQILFPFLVRRQWRRYGGRGWTPPRAPKKLKNNFKNTDTRICQPFFSSTPLPPLISFYLRHWHRKICLYKILPFFHHSMVKKPMYN